MSATLQATRCGRASVVFPRRARASIVGSKLCRPAPGSSSPESSTLRQWSFQVLTQGPLTSHSPSSSCARSWGRGWTGRQAGMGWWQVPPDPSLCCLFLPGDRTSTTSTSSLASTTSTSSLAFPAHLPSPHLADAQLGLLDPSPPALTGSGHWLLWQRLISDKFFCQGSGHTGKLALNQESVWGPRVTHLHPELQVGGL